MKTIFTVLIFILSINLSDAQWVQMANGMGIHQHVNAIISSGNNIFAGTQGGGVFVSTDYGGNWNAVNNGLTNPFVKPLILSGINIFAGTYNYNSGSVFLSTNNGGNWTNVNNGLTNLDILSLGSNGTNIFAGTQDGGVYLSTDNGGNWIAVNNGLTSLYVPSLAISGINIFAGTNDGVFLSTNNGGNWIAVNNGLTSLYIQSLAINGINIFAGTNDGVFLSTNNGGSWNAVNSGLTNLRAYSLLPIGNNIFAGTTGGGVGSNGGVFLSTNNGGYWTAINQGFYDSIPTAKSLLIANNYIYAATEMAVWRRHLIFIDLLNPANNSINNPINLNLVWKRQPFATTYHAVLATDSLFTNIIVNDSTLSDTTKYISGLSNNTQYYWKVRGKNAIGWGNFYIWKFATIIAAPGGVPALITPINNSINLSLTPTLDWSDVSTATKYDVMVSTDSLYNTYAIFDSSAVSQYTVPVNKLTYDKKYFWKTRAKNIGGNSQWSTVWNFRTVLGLTHLDTLIRNNKSITMNWSLTPPDPNIIRYRIYRGLSSPASTLIDSVAGNQFTYTDTNLTNGTTYYYRIKSLNNINIESGFSNEKSTAPFNRPPVTNSLTNFSNQNIGRVLTQNHVFNSSGSTDPDGTIDSVFWFVNNQLIISAGSLISLNYNFFQGLNTVKLIVQDNDGARDSSKASVCLSAFRKYFGGSNASGLSMIGDSVLFAVITQGNNSAVNKLDINGNITLTLNVNGNILSSSCIGYDTSVFIGSTDNNLYAFSRFGASLWPPLPLGGQLVVSPTFDSSANRIYVGVSNNNFFCINKITGQIIWSMFGNSPMRNSAVITNNKRLFVTSQSGTIYGIDLNNLIIGGGVVTPNWLINGNDTITSSPAIDLNGYFYVGTKSGKLKKIAMTSGQPGTVIWETLIGGSINSSPVIDANGNIYVGSTNGQFYAVNNTGGIKWGFTTSGQINTTAAISNYSRIYFGNMNGDFYCIDTNAALKWYYKDSSAIGNCVLTSKGSIYYGTSAGVLADIYDFEETENMSFLAVNVWSTYQSNNQRTGSRDNYPIGIENISEIIPEKFELYQNYPNPFNPRTIIKFQLPMNNFVNLKIYDILGHEVSTLVDKELKAGKYQVDWDGGNYASGLYFYRIIAGDYVETKKMMMIK